jgi:hypothetical protein
MVMSNFTVLFNAALIFIALSAANASAQQTPSGGIGVTTPGTEGVGGTPDSTAAADLLNPDAVFSAVERGDTVGSTGSTGAGFSDLSAASGGGGGAGGGLGGLGGGLGGLGGFGGLGNLFGNRFNTGAAQSAKPAVRTRLRSAIDIQATPPATVQQVLNQRLRTLPTQPQLRGVNVTMQGRTAIIRGEVGSQRDRRMTELLMRLEPGVRSVDNQVTVLPQ